MAWGSGDQPGTTAAADVARVVLGKRTAMGQQSDAGVAAALELADLLEAGGWPPPIAVPARLEDGEMCYSEVPVTMHQFLEGDGEYLHKTRFGLSPMGVAVGVATMAGNQRRKQRAAREAEAQWRFTGCGTAYITNQRVTIQEGHTWNNVWYRDVMAATCDATAFVLQRTGLPGIRLAMPEVYYHFVLLYRLAFDRVVRPPADR